MDDLTRALQGLTPEFVAALQPFLAAAPGPITINSGYRSPERQAELYAAAVTKYGSPEAARKWVAPPGHSNHNHGLAADLGYSSPEVEAWAHANAANFGLNFRMAHEPWHIELAADGTPVAVPDAPSDAGPPTSLASALLPPPVAAARPVAGPAFQTQLETAPGLIRNQNPTKLAELLNAVSAATGRV